MPPFAIDPDKDTICDVIRRWAEVQPDAPAVLKIGSSEEDVRTMSYSGLAQFMEAFRAALSGAGSAFRPLWLGRSYKSSRPGRAARLSLRGGIGGPSVLNRGVSRFHGPPMLTRH